MCGWSVRVGPHILCFLRRMEAGVGVGAERQGQTEHDGIVGY